jgi:predicted RNA-binding Zn-ribbon protein involved in translation (DUF1610 family)
MRCEKPVFQINPGQTLPVSFTGNSNTAAIGNRIGNPTTKGDSMANKLPQLIKSMTGKHKVKYGCPKCGETLVNPLSQAGAQDTCPKCNQLFIVPGKNFADKFIAEAEAKKQQLNAEANEKQNQKIENAVPIHKAVVPPTVPVRYDEVMELEKRKSKKRTLKSGSPALSQRDTEITDNGLKIIALLAFLFGEFLSGFFVVNLNYGSRFQDDNAVGATANILELGLVVFASWCWCFFAVAIFFYVKLRQLVRK